MITAEDLRAKQILASEEWHQTAANLCETISKDLEEHVKSINCPKSLVYIICRGKIKRKDENGNFIDFFDLSMSTYVINILKQNGYTVNCTYDKTNCNGKFVICW